MGSRSKKKMNTCRKLHLHKENSRIKGFQLWQSSGVFVNFFLLFFLNLACISAKKFKMVKLALPKLEVLYSRLHCRRMYPTIHQPAIFHDMFEESSSSASSWFQSYKELIVRYTHNKMGCCHPKDHKRHHSTLYYTKVGE